MMSACPLLEIPDFSKPFELECDASREGIGVVLMQDKLPIAIERKKLRGAKKNYSKYDKSVLAIMHALAKFRPDFVGGKFIVKTHHNNLKYFLN